MQPEIIYIDFINNGLNFEMDEILVDDIGTIFSKSDLEKYFQILLFEKDIEVINFDTNKIEDFVKVTLLRKR